MTSLPVSSGAVYVVVSPPAVASVAGVAPVAAPVTAAAAACCSGVGVTAVAAAPASPVAALVVAAPFFGVIFLPVGVVVLPLCCCETRFHGRYFQESIEQEESTMLVAAIAVRLNLFMCPS